ncbi:hypothetical protein ACGF8B_11610 [Streptomyces sp. NPDC047917]|uniref:hypothetical protein n=1 Tax=Streptomyces sp. NPDC047917 TaxID=3365491 RepID=UPI00371E7B4A
MADVDVSQIDPRVRDQVARRGLFLVSPDSNPADGLSPEQRYVFVCKDPDPDDVGFTGVGHVIDDRSTQTYKEVFALDGTFSMGSPARQQVPGLCMSWEQGIMTVLEAFDRWSGLYPN